MTYDNLRYRVARGIGMIRVGQEVPPDWTLEEMWKVIGRDISGGAQSAMFDYCGRLMAEYIERHDDIHGSEG